MQEDVIAAGTFVEVVGFVRTILADGAFCGGIKPDIGKRTAVAEPVFCIIKVDVITAGITVKVAVDVGEMDAAIFGAKCIFAPFHRDAPADGIVTGAQIEVRDAVAARAGLVAKIDDIAARAGVQIAFNHGPALLTGLRLQGRNL